MKKIKCYLLLIAICCVQQISVLAEEVETPSLARDPGVINRFNQELIKELSSPELEPEKEECEGLEVSKELYRKNSEIQNVGLIKMKPFVLNSVVLDGNTVIKEKVLKNVYSPFLGKTVNFDDVQKIAEKISELYNKKGFITSYAYVNPSDINNGSVTIHVFEGKIGQVEVEGNKRSKEYYIKNNVLAQHHLEEGQVFNVNDAKNCLENINSRRYMKGQIAVEKAEKSDTSEIKLKLDEKLPISCNVMWDNDGNGMVGDHRATMLLADNNLFGFGHSIYGGGVLARGTQGVLAGYKMPVGKHGTELQFDYSFTHVNYGGELVDRRISGNAHKYSTRIFQPLYSKNNTYISTDLGVDFINATSMSYGEEENEFLGDYRLTVLRHGVNLKKYDKTGLFFGRFESSFGVPILGATASTSRYFGNDTTEAQSAFSKFKLDLWRLQKLPKKCMGIVRVSTQYSPNNLYPTEQINFGGVPTIRGYEPGLCLADSGVNGTFEIRTPVPFLKYAFPERYRGFSDRVKLGMFYDWGVFSNQNTGVKMTGASNFLQSVGAGVHIKLTDTVLASFQVGVPVGASIYKEKSAMFQFAIRADVWDVFAKKPKLEEI